MTWRRDGWRSETRAASIVFFSLSPRTFLCTSSTAPRTAELWDETSCWSRKQICCCLSILVYRDAKSWSLLLVRSYWLTDSACCESLLSIRELRARILVRGEFLSRLLD